MNFFEHQTRARRRTFWYVTLFVLAVAAIVGVFNIVALSIVWMLMNDLNAWVSLSDWLAVHPQAMLWTTFLTIGFVATASFYRVLSLASGGGAVALEVGGVLVHGSTSDPRRRQLLNIVEEMAIASGVPVPEVYVLEEEVKINAFAAGYSPSDAVIAVTRGAIERLTRDELQGVIAHEFSHLLNGDMRLNTRLIGLLFGILAVGLAGRLIMRGAVEANDARGALFGFAAGLMLTIVGYTGLLFGRLIQTAVSRSCERLADASAVQFTRHPGGLAGALKKIAVLGGTLLNVRTEQVNHMLVADGRKLFDAILATHPPVLERIRAIEPQFDPRDLQYVSVAPVMPEDKAKPKPELASPSQANAAKTIAMTVGTLSAAALAVAADRRDGLPKTLMDAAHSYTEAVYLILASVLSREPETRRRQIAAAQTRMALDPAATARIMTLADQTAVLDLAYRLPLLELAFTALRRRAVAELRTLALLVDEWIHADGTVGVFEYSLARLLRLQLYEAIAPHAQRNPRADIKLHALRGEVQTLFSVLAQSGQTSAPTARAAYERGARRLLPMQTPEYMPPRDWTTAFDRALTRLDALAPKMKQELVEALALTIEYDQQVTTAEAELLRIVCATLHCPLPLLPVAA